MEILIDEIIVKVKTSAAFDGLELPAYQSAGAAGLDLPACVDEPVILQPGERVLIPTGLFLEMPQGIEAQVRPRSGLALKQGLSVLNSPGTIDADYRGEVGVILINFGREAVRIERGMRIAQLVFARYIRAKLCLADELSDTERGSGGFGHSGV